jgi:23S rRNA (uridine2552-2'-O)-methyltransferase
VHQRMIMARGGKWEDHYTRRARDEKWLARSVYKLQEIDEKFRLIRTGSRLLDLGAYPGSWSQYSLKKVGPKGELVGIDLQTPGQLSAPNFRFIKGDILTLDVEWLYQQIGERDAVLSDLAPKTTGIQVADISRSEALAGRALEIALAVLKVQGHFLCKIFEGEDLKTFRTDLSRSFKQVRTVRPQAVRKRSREVYLLGLGRLGGSTH